MEAYETNYTNICKPSAIGLSLIPGNWNMHRAKNLCKILRGEINVISSDTNNDEILNMMIGSSTCAEHVWTGWWDLLKEGEWIPVSSSIPLQSQFEPPWMPGEPNGQTKENCAVMKTIEYDNETKGIWNDVSCSYKYCAACQIPSKPTFYLRGKRLI